jgi:hypothetical protein
MVSTNQERNVKKSLIAVVAVLLFVGTGAVQALAVVNRATGERIPVYMHRGRLYVPGTPGAKYSLLLTNRTGERVLAVTSVDGINVITGETAAPGQSGYVLDPRGSVDIDGWRKSMSEVAAFVFTSLPDSYAARTDRPGNVGVIGVAVFREVRPPRRRPLDLQQPEQLSGPAADASGEPAPAEAARDSAPSSGALGAQAVPAPFMRDEKLGTGHGERETSWASRTVFRRASESPSELLSIYYDSRANLIALGVIPGRSHAEPNPFPGLRFTPDPRS